MLVIGFALFSVPSMLGTTAEIEVLAVRSRAADESSHFPPDLDDAVVLGLVMVVLIGQRVAVAAADPAVRQLRDDRRRASQPGHARRLGAWRWPARPPCSAICWRPGAAVRGLVLVSLQSFWSATIRFDRLDLDAYRTVLVDNEQTRKAFQNSTLLGAAGATAAIASRP